MIGRNHEQASIGFERKFDFSSGGTAADLCARLRGTPARLEEALTITGKVDAGSPGQT
jgi:hypothetical protein